MPKKIYYEISAADPDIQLAREKFPEIFEKILSEKFFFLPGEEMDTWNNLELFNGGLFGEYIDHCLEHFNFLVGRWSQDIKEKLFNFIETLREENYDKKEETLKKLFMATTSTNFPRNLGNTSPTLGLPIALQQSISRADFNRWVNVSFEAWIELAQYCNHSGLFDKFIDTGSQSRVRPHHFLAGQAAYIMALAHQQEGSLPGTGVPFLPIIFKILQQAIIWQQEDKAALKNQAKAESKKRKLESPDSFIFRLMMGGKNSKQLRGTNRDLFIKVWLFRFTEQQRDKEGKQYLAKELVYEMRLRFPECQDMSDKTLANLLTNMKQPGYATKKIEDVINQ